MLRLGRRMREHGHGRSARRFETQPHGLNERVDLLRKVLLEGDLLQTSEN